MTVWKIIDGWTYEYFDLDTPSSEFPGFEDMHALWHEKRAGRVMPSWSDFDFYDFIGWHGHINKATILQDPFGYRFDLFGRKSVSLLGEDWTGKSFVELQDYLTNPQETMQFYKMTVNECLISRVSGSIKSIIGAEHKQGCFLELPLSDDGKTVSHNIEVVL